MVQVLNRDYGTTFRSLLMHRSSLQNGPILGDNIVGCTGGTVIACAVKGGTKSSPGM